MDSDRVFRVSYRVQFVGVLSLVFVPAILGAAFVALFVVSVALGLVIALVFVVGLQVALAKRWTGMKPKAVSVGEAPDLHAIVERLCAQGDLAKPRIVLHEERFANSWVTGLTSRGTTLHLTTRLLEVLDANQLEAVIAHELAHVGQKDSGLMSAIGIPVAGMLDGAELYFHSLKGYLKNLVPVRSRNSADTTADTADLSFAVSYLPLLLLPVGIMFLVLGEVCRAVIASFSRARELEADAGAARLTGNASALASALITLSAPRDAIPLEDLRKAANLDVFHIVAIGKERPLLHTHPPLRRRLDQLSEIEQRLQHAHPT